MTLHTSLVDIVGIDTGSAGMGRVQLNRRGLPISAVDGLLDCGRLTATALHHLVPPRKPLAHRRKIGTLTPEPSDRLMRVARLIAADLGGEGARRYGGCWNSPGLPMIHAASTACLTVLEVRVHFDRPPECLPDDHVLVTIDPGDLAIDEFSDMPAPRAPAVFPL